MKKLFCGKRIPELHSGPDSMCSRADKQGYPPPLPVKQRRSVYSGGSSTGSSMDLEPEGEKYSPLGSLHETPSFSDVFSTPTDCHAPQCPIHHSAGFSCSHQERFFSETTPPPVPKKRLARAVSLPGGCLHPQCSLPSKHLSYDNPLYMLTTIKDSHLDTERKCQKPAFDAPPPLQPLRLLTFDTPDLQLPCFFKSFQDQGEVSLDIQECHRLFLKRIAQQLETLSVGGVDSTNGIESFQAREFQLCKGYQSKRIEGAVCYSVHCPKLPGRVFSAKVYRPNGGGTASALLNPLPPHINIQQLFVHFSQCPETERYANAENLQAGNSAAGPQQREQASLQSPDGGSIEQDRCEGHTVASLLSEGYEVDIERELPRATLEDFVRDGISLHRSQPQLYERQLSLLLLQVAQGLLHLRGHGAACAELQPRDVILAWSGAKGEGEAEGVGVSGRDTTEREPAERGACGRATKGQECGEDLSAPIHKLWKRWGPPRAVISAFQPLSESDTGADSEEFRLGRLLLLCLHLPESPAPPDPRPSQWDHQGSPFPHGLLELAFRLLDSESGVRMAEAAGILQVLLWGPRVELFPQNQPGTWPILLGNWLAVKRSLLVQKLSERALSEDGRPDREDNLCLQYLSLVDPNTVLKIAALLGLQHTSTSVTADV
ncbi:hypothetical protein SKAU_G00049880 [Synaphobranchus kaupii]|uniref:Uncharacterized protein n=1 Tax=Synaphobranchus kaupii TaxID=118154 RepID=A0A9Q1G2S2_SYNKA|nr:hypothetical protein SKAU_G00049880 [Synaphobranchus kaupii]